MSSQHNNPITNSIDFASHGNKQTSIGNIEHQFNVTQSGAGSDPTNTSLSAYSLQSDMLTSAYFNAEVGELRETLGAYQIKVSDYKHRAIFVGGTNYRDGYSSTNVDVNVGNYPVDVSDNDTNTGKSYASNEGIPNMTLKGNSFSSSMPIFPLTQRNNPSLSGVSVNSSVLSQFSNNASLYDAIQLLRTIFTLNTININIGTSSVNGNSSYLNLDSSGMGSSNFGSGTYLVKQANTTSGSNNCVTNIRKTGTGFLGRNAYIALTSAVTQWVKICAIKVTVGTIDKDATYEGLLDTNGAYIKIPSVTGFEVKLIIDGSYCPRQMIGNGMSHQQLFVWNETSVGNVTTANTLDGSGNSSWLTGNYLQFSLSNYLVYNKDAATDKTTSSNLCSITRNSMSHNIITITPNSSGWTAPTAGQYLWVAGTDPLSTTVMYTVKSVTGTTYTLVRPFSNTVTDPSGNASTQYYCVAIASNSTKLVVMDCHRFNIDEIRDRYSMLQLISHLGSIYKTGTNLSLPLKLVEYMSQVVCNTNISLLLYYVSLCELYASRGSSTIDIGKRLNQIFHFIQNDNNYQTHLQGGNAGTALKYWNDLTDSVNSSEGARFTCLNTNLQLITAQTSTNLSQSKTYNIQRMNKVKHIVITNLPGFDNGRYGTTMSSSNMIHGYFGSLAIDLSYSDTHTPVDVNGMTVHQWNYDSNINLNGLNNPSLFNVNADENYRNLVTSASSLC